MKSTNKCKNVGFSMILWAVIGSVLSAASPVQADVTVPDGEEWDISYDVGGFLNVEGTANVYTGAIVAYGIYAYEGSTVNIFGGDISGYPAVSVSTFQPAATVKVYGTDFEDSEGSVDYGEWTPIGYETLAGTDTSGYTFSMVFSSDYPIYLIPPVEILIERLIADVEALNLKEGIENSLDAKLQNALDALEAANAGQRQDAINKMEAFKNAVEAQSGKWIDVDDANALIASAQEIIDLLLTE